MTIPNYATMPIEQRWDLAEEWHEKILERSCRECGALFTTTIEKQRYCSEECSTRYHAGRSYIKTGRHQSNYEIVSEPVERDEYGNDMHLRGLTFIGKELPYMLMEHSLMDGAVIRCNTTGETITLDYSRLGRMTYHAMRFMSVQQIFEMMR